MIRLKYCSVLRTDWGCVTRFYDGGVEVPGEPHRTAHYSVIAHRLGYGDDVHRYCFEHEFAHSFWAERMKGGRSYVLGCLADHVEPVMWMAVEEEIAAQTFQRWLRASERPIVGGVPWDDLKRDALDLLMAE